MVRKLISIFFYILGGFFIYGVCLLAFVNMPEIGAFKFAIAGGFCIPALVFLIIGAAIGHFENWRSYIAAALLSGVGINMLVVISFVCMLSSPDFAKLYPDNKLAFFNDYLSGACVMLFFAGLGVVMLVTNKKKFSEPVNSVDVERQE